MIIDSHQHFWNYDPVRDSWIDETMGAIRRDFLPEDLSPILKSNGVDGCVAVQADQSETETDFLLDLAGRNQFIKGVVGWVDLRSDEVEDRLAHFSANRLLKGVRHIVQGEPVEFMLGKEFQHGISKLAQFGLSYDILVFPHQLKPAVELVKKFPDQLFVLDHIAKPRISDGLESEWCSDIQQLSSFENVYCKLSGMVTEATDLKFEEREFTPFMDHVLNCFGADRLMFGSDWPVCRLAANYDQVLKIVKDFVSGLTQAEQQKILGINAVKFYRLDN